MVLRVRSKARPGDKSRDIDLGEHGNGTPMPWKAMRMELDEAIVYAATRGHMIKASR